jgi:hypothetical protein
MDQNKRNEVIAKNEDMALDEHLDQTDSCEVCFMDKGIVEWAGNFICMSCYENALEAAEMRCEDR